MGSSGKEGPLGHHSHVQGDATAAKLVRVSVAAQHRAPCGAGLEAMVMEVQREACSSWSSDRD